MARLARVQFEGALYHVLDRGDRREAIFRDDVDRQRFLRTLGEVCARTGWRVHAWVLMSDLAALVTQRTAVNNQWLADALCLGDPSRVSQALRRVTLHLMAMVALIFGCPTFAQDNGIPPAMQPVLDRALEASSIFGHAVEPGKAEQRQTAFRDALTRIAKECDERTAEICRSGEGDSMEKKIVCIALDFREHLEHYEEVAKVYLHAPLPPIDEIGVGGPNFPRPKAAHLDERYRLVWEYMMLWPEQSQINYRSLGDFQKNVVLSALKTINSLKSQVLYEYCFMEAAKADIFGREWTSDATPWTSMLDAMALQQTPKSVQRMLRCLDALKANAKFYTKVRKLIIGLLIGINSQWVEVYFGGAAPKENPYYPEMRARREIWASAIKQASGEGLPPDLQAVLKDALESPQY